LEHDRGERLGRTAAWRRQLVGPGMAYGSMAVDLGEQLVLEVGVILEQDTIYSVERTL
jgi:hypothetical protein